MKLSSIPVATYRLQINSQMTFKQAETFIGYLKDLGISHLYTAPLLTSKKGSTHGYDIIDHNEINPEIGKDEEFEEFVQTLHKNKMGLILDIVPNHMYIRDPENKWWHDVLENGRASHYADYFDIDWNPPRITLDNKVLLPLLEEQYGNAIENQAITTGYADGVFFINVSGLRLPTDPKSWTQILEPLVREAKESLAEDADASQVELESILTALKHLPPITETSKDKIAERDREKEVIKKRLASLIESCPAIKEQLMRHLVLLNGEKDKPESMDALDVFLSSQPYRLCFWRVANDEINYRRFFDITEFAGIRTEKRKVFEESHALIRELIQKRFIDGVRIDHIDGLWDPEQYLLELHKQCISKESGMPQANNEAKLSNSFYIVAEKILLGDEKLSAEWLLYGTVGYDFLNQLNGVFVDQSSKKDLLEIYHNFTCVNQSDSYLLYNCKKLVLDVSLSSELNVLARRLDKIAAQHRYSRDFTMESLKHALGDIIACFPVYRSYIRASLGIIHNTDRKYISSAVSKAKRLNPSTSPSIYDFIQSVLLLDHPKGLDEAQKEDREEFVMRFQQLTGPVMAKGLEDTASYRSYPLSSLREVGSDPYGFGISVETFHEKNLERMKFWPHSMLASSTHDTKRSEDVRARINVLSEISQEWGEVLARWAKMNAHYKAQDADEIIPDANEEYLLYQTLIGSWPLNLDKDVHGTYVERIQMYMEKAIKEAKINSSWINPNKSYEVSVRKFIEQILNNNSENHFLEDFKKFIPKVIDCGMLNSLSQVILKLASPGVPDIYQGNELWDFSLVDPDNRRAVDFSPRAALFQALQSQDILAQSLKNPEDGRIKLYITARSLALRKKYPDLFAEGCYMPLTIEGKGQKHIIAFLRMLGAKAVLVIASRFFASLPRKGGLSISPEAWEETAVRLPEGLGKLKFIDQFTGLKIEAAGEEPILHLQTILGPLPFALLESIEN